MVSQPARDGRTRSSAGGAGGGRPRSGWRAGGCPHSRSTSAYGVRLAVGALAHDPPEQPGGVLLPQRVDREDVRAVQVDEPPPCW
ncbi:hypothetical protein [Streptosporangium vulgare]|uniref:hypothetical protein n=1 Tax=Streptosporangium vulgare TaxID=46190 RepID=UPI0031DE8135